MQLTNSPLGLLSICILTTSITALPTPSFSHPNHALMLPAAESTTSISALDPRAPIPTSASPTSNPGIYICTSSNWQGSCFWTIVPPPHYGLCGSVTALNGWNSLGPDKGIAVDVYMDAKCTQLVKEKMIWPGISDLADSGAYIVNQEDSGVGEGGYFGVKVWAYSGTYPE